MWNSSLQDTGHLSNREFHGSALHAKRPSSGLEQKEQLEVGSRLDPPILCPGVYSLFSCCTSNFASRSFLIPLPLHIFVSHTGRSSSAFPLMPFSVYVKSMMSLAWDWEDFHSGIHFSPLIKHYRFLLNPPPVKLL